MVIIEGPIAAFRLAAAVSGLPRTRSGKIARKSISDLARNKLVKVTSAYQGFKYNQFNREYQVFVVVNNICRPTVKP